MPELEDILKTTYGFIIYQEQIMRIAVDIAGYTMGAADKLRKAMGKKIMEVMKKEETKFKDGMVANGFKRKVADQLWEFVLPFADYGFNKAHAAAYAVLAYKCAYLKANYPIEFMAALLHSDLNNSERIVVDMKEAQRMGFQILPPDINKSGVYFSVEGEDTIRFGLGAIKNVGNKICEDITAARKKQGDFTSLDDLITKVGADKLSKRVLESLIMAGAMDQYGERNALLAILPAVFDRSRKQQSVTSAGQMSLFGGRKGQVNQDSLATPLPNLEPVAESQKVMWEKDLLGVFLSTHPLEQYTWAGLLSDFYELSQLSELRAGTKVKTLAIVDERSLIRTKADNKPMSFLTLADMTGTSDAVMFSRVHAEYNEKIEEARPYVIEGTLNFRNDTHSVLIDSIMPADDITPPKRISINICSIEDKEILQELKSCFSDDGDVNVDILYGNKSHPKRITRKLSLSPRAIETIKPYLVRG
jgi:DNA polymerase-3 subunit alpha